MVEWVEKINLAAMEIPTMAEDSMKAHCNGCGPHRTHNILFRSSDIGEMTRGI